MGAGGAAVAGGAAATEGADGAARMPLKLVGYSNFKRHNPMSDRFKVYDFHSVEFWCSDATSTSKR
jgi:4-hydroxyphenylpyruvate dioxygenase